MIKDKLLRIFCITALGIIIPYLSGIITYHKYSEIEFFFAISYFIFLSYCIWIGAKWIHSKCRNLYSIHQDPYLKLISTSLITGSYSAVIGGILCFLWMHFSKEIYNSNPIFQSIFLIVLAVLLFTLVNEILYLSKEREIDNKIVNHLDHELAHAEMALLRKELDPHFIFNTLNTLSHLISSDPIKANLFNSNLAEVYKYFLINKENDLISVDKEIIFIKKYFFLLQIRYGNKLKLHINLEQHFSENMLIIPCALQILVENAINHNEFSSAQPLHIFIDVAPGHLIVYNDVISKFRAPNSTNVGLKNLRSQYMLSSRKEIIIEKSENHFLVKLPIINVQKKYNNDYCSYYRGRITSTEKTINFSTGSLP